MNSPISEEAAGECISNKPAPRVMVAQLGSRMHYAVPIALNRAGLLELLVTDITARSRIMAIAINLPRRVKPKFIRRLAGRVPGNLPPSRIREYPTFGIWIAFLRKLAAPIRSMDRIYVWIGRNFARRSARALPEGVNSIYSFNGASLELFQSTQARGCLKILEQTMAPRLIEDRLLREANQQFPGWCDAAASNTAFHRPALYDREMNEWLEADVIACGSDFVVKGIAEAGGPVEKCVTIPYAVDTSDFLARVRELDLARPVNVLFVGAVSLRKGAPYVLETARELSGAANFRMVGAIQIPQNAERQLREVLELTGPVPRVEMATHFEWADIFLLPSLCEGSATVTYEAMASGLPQVVTENAGSYIDNNMEGLIVDANVKGAIANAIRHLAQNPENYRLASLRALEKSQTMTLDHYCERLEQLFETHLASETWSNKA